MTTETTQEARVITVTRDDLTEALTEFYLTVRSGPGHLKGQVADPGGVAGALHATLSRIAAERGTDDELTRLRAKLAKAEALIGSFERITTAWTRGMYSAWVDCQRGDVKAAIECLSEGLDGYDGTEWNETETGAEWWERTKAEEGL